MLVQSCPERNMLVTWWQPITKFLVKKVSRGAVIDILWWYKIFGNSVVTILPMQSKNFSGDPEWAQWSSRSRPGNQKSFTLTIPWNLDWQVLWRIILESLYVNATQIRNAWDCRKEQCAEWKKGHLRYRFQSGLDKAWRADSMECYCFLRNTQDLLSDWKTPYERRFGMLFNGPVIHFEQWSNITLSLRRTYCVYINLVPKSCQVYFSVMSCTRVNLEADIEELEEMDASEIYAKRLNAKEVFTPMKGDNFYIPSRRWNSQNTWRIDVREHPP